MQWLANPPSSGRRATDALIVVPLLLLILFFHQGSSLTDTVRQRPYDPVTYPPGSLVAIDIGNTNSCVAGYGHGGADTMFHLCIPSWVAFTSNGTLLVGDDARTHAAVDPGSAIFGFKRLIGRRWNHMYDTAVVQRVIKAAPYKLVERDMRPHVQVKARGGGGVDKEFSAPQITAMVIGKLKEAAEAYLGRPVRAAVFTVPQQYNDARRDAALYAGEIAGLRAARVLDEPIAAAVAHGLHRRLRDGGVALVLHVGGGTSEASVLTLVDGVFDFLGAHHDHFLGGDDIDRRTTEHFVSLIKQKHGKDISNNTEALRKLSTACEHAKKTLSTRRHAHLRVDSLVDGFDLSETLTRAEFESLNHDLFVRIISLVDRAMVVAELEEKNKAVVDEIILVGGSTMIPKIQKLVSDYFNGKLPNAKLKPDEAVTIGAALLSHPTANGYPCMGVDNRHQIGYFSDLCYTHLRFFDD